MILLAVLLVQAVSYESTAQELSFCAGDQSGQPERFCLADRKHKRAERELAAGFNSARRAAVLQKQEIARVGAVTLAGDPARALDASQKAWRRSYRADCLAVGLASATGNGGTEGVIANWKCEADRMLDRAHFLANTYSAGR